MKKIRAAVVGYGNIGKYALEALQAAEDFEIAGVVRRNASDVPASLAGIPVVSSLKDLKDVEVAILATPTRKVEQYALEALSLGISTVDSFDIHTKVPALRKTLGEAARKAGKVSIISAGWDPGSDSMVRAIL
ncbi:MAG: Gfo/Idh/MocA family oxidoreductase, partial [Bacteroidales bacterium]|nr:Gfo/Idh/MocA family oxidoreductase [Bacteroidales bacterium]